MSTPTILIVDDEPSIIQLARLYLEREGCRVHACADGGQALGEIARLRPDLVVLDVMLPGMDGFEICKRLSAEKNPVLVIMLTARDDDIDKILGLELGADDYLTKPFNPRELVARVKAILRRTDKNTPLSSEAPLRLAGLTIDPARREVTIDGQPVDLRTQEFELLYILAQNRGLVLSREKLLEKAWGFNFFGQTRTVDVHIAQLRRKIAASAVKIETVTGIGYKLVV